MSEQTERVVEFTAGDGLQCNVINVRGEQAPVKGPVLLVHGAGVRANIFRAPSGRNLVDLLVDEGWDVWLENWRASIEIPHNHWTLDQAAVYDHPRAVQTVCAQTGADEIKAVIHCQGSTSFMMSALAGLVPQVRTIVSNAVSIHPVVPRLANLKLRSMIPVTARVLGYLDPQWGRVGAPWIVPKLVDAWIKLDHHECNNSVCKWSSYTYGAAKPTLWRHENLNEPTHEWLKDEFAAVPLTFFSQILRCVRARRLLTVEDRPELPRDFTAQAPETDARIVFIAGAVNRCFTAESQCLSHAWYSDHARTALHIFDGYGHLDMFMGDRAAHEVFPNDPRGAGGERVSIAGCLRGKSAGRLRRESGRHALVDGIPFTLPVASHESPALMAAFSIDARAAADLLPGNEVHPLRLWGERALLLISVVDYRFTNIGRYIEFSIAIACTHGERSSPPLTPALPLAQRLYGTGQYVIDLPVSSEVSVKGGKGIWGMPKHQANLDFVIAPRKVSSQYDLDGRLCVRIEVDRPRFESLPLALSTSNYCAFRGMLMKSNISFRGRAGFNLPLTRSAHLEIGEHPRVQALKRLDISSHPLFSGYFPSTKGILDDHIDSWFLSFQTPPSVVPEGLESVAGLGQSQEWLAPPRDPALDEPGAQAAKP